MSKGLQALKDIREFIEQARTTHIITDGLKVIEKELKALDIIKEKRFDIAIFFETNASARHRKPLTQEEYDLLKEVLL